MQITETLSASVENLSDPRVAFRARSKALPLAALGVLAAADSPDVVRDLEVEGTLRPTAPGGLRLSATVKSPSGSLSGAAYRDLDLALRMDGPRVELSRLTARAFDGTLALSASRDAAQPARPAVALDLRLEDVRLEEVHASRGLEDPPATGSLDLALKVQGVGAEQEELQQTLRGGGSLQVRDGVLRDFNPAADTLRQVAAIPQLAGSKLTAWLGGHPELTGSADTRFETIEGRFELLDGWLHFRDFRLAARDYTLTGQGRQRLRDSQLDLTTTLVFSVAESEKLLAADKRLGYLRTAQGRVGIPVAIKGRPPALVVYPDLVYVGKAVARDVVGGLLRKALSGAEGEEQAGEGAEQPPPPASPVEELGRDLIRRGLGGLLGDRKD